MTDLMVENLEEIMIKLMLLLLLLWRNFVLGANFIFLCLKSLSYIIIHYHTPETKENKICTKDKIAPQQL